MNSTSCSRACVCVCVYSYSWIIFFEIMRFMLFYAEPICSFLKNRIRIYIRKTIIFLLLLLSSIAIQEFTYARIFINLLITHYFFRDVFYIRNEIFINFIVMPALYRKKRRQMLLFSPSPSYGQLCYFHAAALFTISIHKWRQPLKFVHSSVFL